MRVLEADLDRVRVAVRRPAVVGAWLLLVAILALVLVPLVGWGAIVGQLVRLRPALEAHAPAPLDCTWETLGSDPLCADIAPELLELPSLAEVYLARRTLHRAVVLPTAFVTPPPVIAPLRRPFASIVSNDYERRLIGQVLRDAGQPLPDTEVRSGGWLGRDPILGVPLGGPLPDDATVVQRVLVYQPALTELPDHSGTSPAKLESDDIVRTTEGVRDMVGGPERAHVVDRAIGDLRYFAALRAQAVEHAVARHHEAATAAFAEDMAALEARAEVWRSRRRSLLPAVLGAWGLAGALVVPLIVQRQRTLLVMMDRHALTLDDRRLLWEELDELIWTSGKVVWRDETGVEAELSELSLTNAEIRMLERTSHAMWLQPRDAPSAKSEQAIQQLIEGARRSDPA